MVVIGRENRWNHPKLPNILQLNHDSCLYSMYLRGGERISYYKILPESKN